MIKLIGEQLYQWDTGRCVEITSLDVNEVHFSNCKKSDALVVEAIDGTAPIPNILLQENQSIRVYAVIKDKSGNEQTVDFCRLKITERERPADYVYTEVEIKNYDALEARIKALEENGGGSGGGGIAEETDPTVPEWAKQPTKPTYTAEEVGAASKEEVSKLSEEISDLTSRMDAIIDGNEVAY